jgi:hypothetical protein
MLPSSGSMPIAHKEQLTTGRRWPVKTLSEKDTIKKKMVQRSIYAPRSHLGLDHTIKLLQRLARLLGVIKILELQEVVHIMKEFGQKSAA